MVLMIDEAERLAQIPGALEYLRNCFSRLGEDGARYCVIISGKTDLFQTVVEVFSPLERFFQPITLMPLKEIEVFELLQKSAITSRISFDKGVMQEIARVSEGQPYAVQVFGYCLFEEVVKDSKTTVDKKLLERATSRVYGMLETQLFDRRIREGVGHSKHKLSIIKKLAQTQEDNWSFTAIGKLTGIQKKHGLGVYLTQLVDAGVLRKDTSSGGYSFFMEIFKKFVARRLGSWTTDSVR